MTHERPFIGPKVVDIVQRLQRPNALTGEHDTDGAVRRPEEHVVVNTDDVADIGVDNSAVARNDNPLALVLGDDRLDLGGCGHRLVRGYLHIEQNALQ